MESGRVFRAWLCRSPQRDLQTYSCEASGPQALTFTRPLHPKPLRGSAWGCMGQGVLLSSALDSRPFESARFSAAGAFRKSRPASDPPIYKPAECGVVSTTGPQASRQKVGGGGGVGHDIHPSWLGVSASWKRLAQHETPAQTGVGDTFRNSKIGVGPACCRQSGSVRQHC